MESPAKLPPSLDRALRVLEERFRLVGVDARVVPESEWSSVDDGVRSLIPDWIVGLLGAYAVAGGVLQYPDARRPTHLRLLRFFEPVHYSAVLEEGSEMRGLLEFSLVPFANEADGNAWLVRSTDGPGSAVYLLDHSAWDGTEPKQRNGLVFAGGRLEHVLTSMGISEASYYDQPGGAHGGIWAPEK